jgi:hypothetical protein
METLNFDNKSLKSLESPILRGTDSSEADNRESDIVCH